MFQEKKQHHRKGELMEKELLKVKEVATRLNVCVATVRNWIKSGFLPAHKFGETYRVKWDDLTLFIDNTYTGNNKSEREALIEYCKKHRFASVESMVRAIVLEKIEYNWEFREDK